MNGKYKWKYLVNVDVRVDFKICELNEIGVFF